MAVKILTMGLLMGLVWGAQWAACANDAPDAVHQPWQAPGEPRVEILHPAHGQTIFAEWQVSQRA
jgi:hypothetical protein